MRQLGRTGPDVVTVPPQARVEAGVEIGMGIRRADYPNVARHKAVKRRLEAVRGYACYVGDEMRHLARGVDA
jgi:hypothetical protein